MRGAERACAGVQPTRERHQGRRGEQGSLVWERGRSSLPPSQRHCHARGGEEPLTVELPVGRTLSYQHTPRHRAHFVRTPGPRQMVLRVGRHTVPPLGACDDRGCVCGRRGEVWWTRTWHVPCACMSPVRSSRLGTVKIALCKISVHAGVAFTPRVLWDCGQSSVTDADRERSGGPT